ncbi:uncharacterized protein [Temnothorax longispinosus]|uniref:uncharacterized protein n=1 Tax=Temnothorax longispinosus TaxID=300112 RepID=UPI003A99DD62
MGQAGMDTMLELCNVIWRTGKWPDDWRHSTFVPIYKKGSPTECSNYRTVALIPHASKILLHVLHNRLKCFLLPEIAEKHKAFDSVKWTPLWTILMKMGVPRHLVALVRSLYENNTAAVRVNRTTSNDFQTKAGTRCLKIGKEEFSVGGRRISNLRYADDTTILATTAQEMEAIMERLALISREYGLEINRDKTKIMIIDRQMNNQPNVKEVAGFEVVEKMVYLDSMITNKGGCSGGDQEEDGHGQGSHHKIE